MPLIYTKLKADGFATRCAARRLRCSPASGGTTIKVRMKDAAVDGPALLGAGGRYPAGTAAQDPDPPQIHRYARRGQQGDRAVEASRVDAEDYRY